MIVKNVHVVKCNTENSILLRKLGRVDRTWDLS